MEPFESYLARSSQFVKVDFVKCVVDGAQIHSFHDHGRI
jgi:hypothetical protein